MILLALISSDTVNLSGRSAMYNLLQRYPSGRPFLPVHTCRNSVTPPFRHPNSGEVILKHIPERRVLVNYWIVIDTGY